MRVSENSKGRFPKIRVRVPFGIRIGGWKPIRSMLLVTILGTVFVSAKSGVAQQPSAKEIRRVVTALDASGKAVVLFDSRVPLTGPRTSMWATEKYPPDFSWTADRATTKVGLPPLRGGTVFRIIDFAPITPDVEKMDINKLQKAVGAEAPAKGRPPRHPLMHRTRTLDYAIVMSGEIDMLLDDSDVHLKVGDVVVQQATNHAWVNRGKEICRMAFILMDAEEPSRGDYRAGHRIG
jgi:mannose-6-phosphate isomerase-like protein (cupin superfamily)